MNGFSHSYQLGESTFILRGIRSDFLFFISFFDEISLFKQNSPRWDTAFYGITSGAILFAYGPTKRRPGLNELSMSYVMRKTAFCMCENKDTYQLCSNITADQCPSFHYTGSKIFSFLFLNF